MVIQPLSTRLIKPNFCFDLRFGHLATRSKASVSAPKQGRQAALLNNSNPFWQLSTMVTSVDVTEDQLAAPCPCCTEKRLLKHCKLFERKYVEERWEIVKKRKLCHRCLTVGAYESGMPFTREMYMPNKEPNLKATQHGSRSLVCEGLSLFVICYPTFDYSRSFKH